MEYKVFYSLVQFSAGMSAIGMFNGPECDSSQFIDYHSIGTDEEAIAELNKLNEGR